MRQPFSAHIQELRRRLIAVLIVFGLGGLVGYLSRQALITFLNRPLGQPVFYSSPAGGFEFVMRICGLIGLVAAVPVAVYNLIKFIEPALSFKLSLRQTACLVAISICLMASGLAFAYKVILPQSLHFFADYSSSQIRPLISAKDYLNFVLACLATFAVIFQLPLLMLFIDRIKPLPPSRLRHYRKYVVIGSLAIAVILPFSYDPITQFVIAIPIIALYELSIVLIWLRHRRAGQQAPGPNRYERQPASLPPRVVAVPRSVGQSSPVIIRGQAIDLRGVRITPPSNWSSNLGLRTSHLD